MRLEKLSTSGPAFAALLQNSAVAQSPFDGLLTGSFTIRRERIHHDTADETSHEMLEADISGFCCGENLGSFYNGAGAIDAEEVAAMTRSLQGSCLGWFVHQQGPRRPASARERTVTAALAGCVPHGMPVVFSLMTVHQDIDMSTHTFQQQFYEQAPGTLLLRQVNLSIDNIASFGRTRDYRPLRPVAECHKVSVNSIEQGDIDSTAPQLSNIALHSMNTQTHALENVYLDMLGQMDNLNYHLRREEADLKSLRKEVNALMSTHP